MSAPITLNILVDDDGDEFPVAVPPGADAIERAQRIEQGRPVVQGQDVGLAVDPEPDDAGGGFGSPHEPHTATSRN